MYDSDFVNEEVAHMAARIVAETGPDSGEQARRAFELAFSRLPKPAELDGAIALVSGAKAQNQGLAALCRVLLNTSEFIYID
jgi:hypothetical protein